MRQYKACIAPGLDFQTQALKLIGDVIVIFEDLHDRVKIIYMELEFGQLKMAESFLEHHVELHSISTLANSGRQQLQLTQRRLRPLTSVCNSGN
ncbi:hypothetical protein QCA50_005219 [Cerrena zonata]|uniref:Uncharacterized protein n=1 Tax=Cerrena zonata TaxID=2478898 RepID=A0AAW0GQJ7_9APHY